MLAVAAYTDLRWLLVPIWAVALALALSLGAIFFILDWGPAGCWLAWRWEDCSSH